MNKSQNHSLNDAKIKALEEAWGKFQKEMALLKKRQLQIIKDFQKKSEAEEIKQTQKQINEE
ncbi:MAG: hypothetical protein ACOZBH_04260 [Patescibacteria group bacterium]